MNPPRTIQYTAALFLTFLAALPTHHALADLEKQATASTLDGVKKAIQDKYDYNTYDFSSPTWTLDADADTTPDVLFFEDDCFVFWSESGTWHGVELQVTDSDDSCKNLVEDPTNKAALTHGMIMLLVQHYDSDSDCFSDVSASECKGEFNDGQCCEYWGNYYDDIYGIQPNKAPTLLWSGDREGSYKLLPDGTLRITEHTSEQNSYTDFQFSTAKSTWEQHLCTVAEKSTPLKPLEGACTATASHAFHLRPLEDPKSKGKEVPANTKVKVLAKGSLTRKDAHIYCVEIPPTPGDTAHSGYSPYRGFMFVMPSELDAACKMP